MLSSDLGLGNVFRRIRLFLGLFYWVHQSLQKRLMFVGGDFLYSLERESVKHLLLGSAHLLQERLEGNEAFIVGGVAELLHQVLGLLLGQLLTEVHQQLEQLELQGGVQVAGADEVANVEGVDLAVSLEVIDVKGEVDGINLLLLKSKLSHFVLGGLPLSSLTTIEGEDRTEVPMFFVLFPLF